MNRSLLLLLFPIALLLSCTDTGNGTSFSNEGTPSNPITITVDVTRSGSIAAWGTSYYKFTPANTGVHTISLTNLDSDLSWDLYDDAGWTSLLDYCDDNLDASDEIAQTTTALTSGTTYYLMVDEWDYVGGTFSLLVSYP
jgi:hypothetical protein